ncbi:MAG TPA: PHB depolymerase family esterase [Gemmatimonadaceae bacterium]|nr:PHB depolymerase family esterase [Gemmatimonadaceae bacterium]
MTTGRTVIRIVRVVINLLVVMVLIAGLSFYAVMSFYALNRTNGTIVSAGDKREYLLYIPRSYDRAKPTPLVISLHGAALWPAAQRETSHWNNVADEHGFIVVYPAGMTPLGGGTGVLPKVWLLRPETDVTENVRFISDLIDTLEAAYNIDSSMIYADGYSNGGAMAFALSCRLSNRIAAIGTVSAAQDQQPWSWCGDSRPVPLINFHGTADLVPYNGGRVWGAPRPFPSVPEWTASWARRNRCAPSPPDSAVAADVIRTQYTNCADDADVVLYTIQGGGHQWPGGRPLPKWILGHASNSIDATSLMWAFFRKHRLSPRSALATSTPPPAP